MLTHVMNRSPLTRVRQTLLCIVGQSQHFTIHYKVYEVFHVWNQSVNHQTDRSHCMGSLLGNNTYVLCEYGLVHWLKVWFNDKCIGL